MNFASDDSKDRERTSREATEWFVRLQNPLVSDDTRRAYRDWLMADPAHRDAMRDVSELWRALDFPAAQLATTGWHRAADAAAPRPRRWFATGSRLATAAVVLVALAGGLAVWRDPGLIDRAFADVATLPGERIEVSLADGTLAFLDGDTALKSRMNGERREVTMLRGRVWFDVARDPARPFTVHAGGVDARVLGTAFEVNREAAAVTVERGEVAVSAVESRRGPVKLTASQRVALQDGMLGAPVPVDPEQMFAWRRGLIILDRAPLSQVVEELDKMAPGRVLIADPELKRLTLSGAFRTDEPGAVLEALRSALGLRTVSVPGFATLIYR
ncbi:FecR family protein [Rhodopseudomonas sp. NSM]|uniref:FecR family protein n=1 Tax=Rhodopseudomonas sp. NSM TaxID=3457630 RepID=UPI0040350A50